MAHTISSLSMPMVVAKITAAHSSRTAKHPSDFENSAIKLFSGEKESFITVKLSYAILRVVQQLKTN